MITYPIAITDPVYNKSLKLTTYEKCWMRIIKDERDLPFIQLLIFIHLTVIPGAILLFTHALQSWWWWGFAAIYFYVSQFYFKGSFGLMLHCLCHRKTWKPAYQWIQKYILRVLCPFFGHLGEGYHSHHIGMHHIAGNMPDDTSSTMGYQRDSAKEFMRYWINFMVLGVYNTVQYLIKRKLPRFYVPLSVSEILFYVIAIAMCFFNFKATMVVFIFPFVFARLVMMLGNWAQHCFVDARHPDDELSSSIICINTGYNKKCWNDGYHAFHHLRQAAHYTEYPLMFEKHLDELAGKRTFVFSGIHYLHIFTWVLTKQYDKLSKHMVNIKGAFKSEDEAIDLMKERVKKFDLTNFEKPKKNHPLQQVA